MRSLRKPSKRHEFEALIETENYDVMILGETWFTIEFTDAMIQFEKYNLVSRCDRVCPRPETRGGELPST